MIILNYILVFGLAILLVSSTELVFKTTFQFFFHRPGHIKFIGLFLSIIIKLSYFIFALYLSMKFLPVNPKYLTVAVVVYLSINFVQNLLKLLLWKTQI